MSSAPQTPSTSATVPEPLTDRERRNPLLRIMLHLGIPMTVSLTVHAVLLLLLALTTWSVFQGAPPDSSAGIAVTAGSPTGDALDWSDGSGSEDSEREITADATPLAPTRTTEITSALRGAARPPLTGSELGAGDEGRAEVLGIGAGSAGGAATDGLGAGLGRGGGLGGAGVWDLKSTGKHFAYVVDFSGSIIVAVDDLKRELKRSIGGLRPDQTFNVILFYGAGDQRAERYVTDSLSAKLLPASAENKRAFFRWIDGKAPTGSTEPLAALKRALALRPDAVFLFSDGLFDEQVVTETTAANARRAQIHCLVFDELLLGDASGVPRVTDGAKRMRRIAEQNGGKSKIVTAVDLNER